MLEETAALADEPEEMFAPLQLKPPVHLHHQHTRDTAVTRLPYLMGQEEKVPAAIEERDDYMGEQHPWWKVAVAPSNPTNVRPLNDVDRC